APVTVVHFWATWCAPCITEIPALQRLAADFAAERGFAIVFVAVADNKERVGPFLGAGAEMALYDPKWDVAHRYGTRQLPESYVLVDGKVVQKFDGPANWDDKAVRDKLRERIHQHQAASLRLPASPRLFPMVAAAAFAALGALGANATPR
ncbi:MAG TPA: TlpA disulfide reductase family protein, partial [Thermoanaerobaculia bacterium]